MAWTAEGSGALSHLCVYLYTKAHLRDDLSARFWHSCLGHTGNNAPYFSNKRDTEGQVATEVSGPHSCPISEIARLLQRACLDVGYVFQFCPSCMFLFLANIITFFCQNLKAKMVCLSLCRIKLKMWVSGASSPNAQSCPIHTAPTNSVKQFSCKFKTSASFQLCIHSINVLWEKNVNNKH